jgi:hypothetical protein
VVEPPLPPLADPLPLSQAKRREQYERASQVMAEVMAPLVVAPIEAVLAEQFSQPLGTVETSGRAGYQDLIRGDDPAAGADYVETVAGDRILWPLSVMARLTCSGLAGDRSLTVEYRDSEGIRWLVCGANVTLQATDQQTFCWHPQAGDVAWPVNDAAIAPLAQQFLYPASSLAIHLQGGQAGDQIDQVRISVFVYTTDAP